MFVFKKNKKPEPKDYSRQRKRKNPARLQARLCSWTVLSSLTRTLLASPVASSTQVVNTDAGCVGMMGNVNWRNIAGLLLSAGAAPPQSSLFALPSRGSAGLCRAASCQKSKGYCRTGAG